MHFHLAHRGTEACCRAILNWVNFFFIPLFLTDFLSFYFEISLDLQNSFKSTKN